MAMPGRPGGGQGTTVGAYCASLQFASGSQVSMAAKRPPALDRIDLKILVALQQDGRSTIQKLAESVGLTARPCLERVRRLEAAGIIVGYQAVLALERLS